EEIKKATPRPRRKKAVKAKSADSVTVSSESIAGQNDIAINPEVKPDNVQQVMEHPEPVAAEAISADESKESQPEPAAPKKRKATTRRKPPVAKKKKADSEPTMEQAIEASQITEQISEPSQITEQVIETSPVAEQAPAEVKPQIKKMTKAAREAAQAAQQQTNVVETQAPLPVAAPVEQIVVSEDQTVVITPPAPNPNRRSMRAERLKAQEAEQGSQNTSQIQTDTSAPTPAADVSEQAPVNTVVTAQEGQDEQNISLTEDTAQEQEARKPRRRRRSRRKKDKNKTDNNSQQFDSDGQNEQDSSQTDADENDSDGQSQAQTEKEGNDNSGNNHNDRQRGIRNRSNRPQQKTEENYDYQPIDDLNDIRLLDDEEDDEFDDLLEDDDSNEINSDAKENSRSLRGKKGTGEQAGKKQKREMLINISAGQECRIAVVEEGKLEELYVERLDTNSLVGNIYKGRIVNVEPSIQACFVDFGIGQNGFLHISDVQTSYFRNAIDHSEKVGKKQPRKERPLIQECLRKGQEVVVQVIKAGIGTKGPTLSTYISIPGRYVVLMPGMSHSGVSRKLSQEDRQKMKELSAELNAPEDVGIILRTASLESNKKDLKKDFTYLIRLWKQMRHNINNKKTGPMELYKESDLVIRTIRDVFTTGIDRIYCDNENTWNKINEFFTIAMPRNRDLVKLYTDHVPLFTKYNIEKEIEKLQSKNVPLPHGGSIVIESTEAMVTIDVNSGKYRDNNNAEDTAYKINMVAAEEICRQLKLRDLGGVIVIDFIDMVNNKHKRELEKKVKDLFARDRASTRILRINQFGLMAVTRQRMKASLKNRTYTTCPLCKGAGQLKSSESVAIEAMRKIAYAIEEPQVAELDVIITPAVAAYLLNERRHALVELESKFSKRITVKSDHNCGPEDISFDARNTRGIRIDPWL
ncbi:MAG: Rne/Rng family ribonuclease, partial [Sedimentisphaerales bacterium]|nr:Rne/Rng family ribonuclease [Sedimentisphaerales bacterium]